MKESITYDAMGQRIAKTVTNKNVTMGDKFVTTYYVRDPQGNPKNEDEFDMTCPYNTNEKFWKRKEKH
ncbi:MAG: hypothetical protein IK017_00530 [Paludibacteraceae bacterium]|nr:hypothetical protein [Paludibacteraceae bacterium]